MIVSSHASPKTGSVILQRDHAELASQLALAFGNDVFEAMEPYDLMQFLVLNHDRGWDETDARIGRNPNTGLPYSLVNTPLDELLTSGPRSVDFNSRHHPYCGLLCSMHIWGLFNGRYGLSDKIVVDKLAGDARVKVEAMLQTILAKRDALTLALNQDVVMRPYLAHDKLMQNYKLLQLFDTLALYFNDNASCKGDYPPSRFIHVPLSKDKDTTLNLEPLDHGLFRLSPFPFRARKLTIRQRVYSVPIIDLDLDLDYNLVLAESPCDFETITLVA